MTGWTLGECFDYFGARPANLRWGWSARNEATGTIIVTMWTDQLCRLADGTIVYDVRAREDLEWWRRRPDNRERLANLRWAEARCDGRFRAVIVTCERREAYVRKIVRRYAEPTLVMRLTTLHDTASSAPRASYRRLCRSICRFVSRLDPVALRFICGLTASVPHRIGRY